MMLMKTKKFQKYQQVWEGVKKEIETIDSAKKIEYWKDF